MDYCVRYNKDFRYFDRVTEVIITFDKNFLKNFIKLKEKKVPRIIIHIPDGEAIDKFKENFDLLYEEFRASESEIIFLLPNTSDKELFAKLQGVSAPYFFNVYVNDLDLLYYYISKKPYAIYVTEALGFDIKHVSNILQKNDIKVRVFPNVAQSSNPSGSAITRFFIRPEDISIYEPYVDVCEIWGNEKSINTIFKIYAIQEKWNGLLKEVISSFSDDTSNNSLIKNFGRVRLDCGKRCLKNGSCHLCERCSITLD